MSNHKGSIYVFEVRSSFSTFFKKIRLIYNLNFCKEEQSSSIDSVRKYAYELFEANLISEYIYSIIEEAIDKFSLLLPGKVKALKQNELISLYSLSSISNADVDSVINELMFKKRSP